MNGINDYTDVADNRLIECPICLQDGISTRKHKPVDGVDLGDMHRVCDIWLQILQQNGETCPFNCGATLSLRGRVTNQDRQMIENMLDFENMDVRQIWQESEQKLRLRAVKSRGLCLTPQEPANVHPKKLHF